MTFGEWLRLAASRDADLTMPYSALYEIVDELDRRTSRAFDATRLFDWIKDTFPAVDQVRYTEGLISAEANYRIDSLVMDGSPVEPVHEPEEVEVEEPSTPAIAGLALVSSHLTTVIPSVPCGFQDLHGRACPEDSVSGGARCAKHGGLITDPEVRRSLLVVAYAKLVAANEVAVDALVEVAEYGRSEIARVQAANSLLDRGGITAEQHVVLHDSTVDDDGSERLSRLRDRLDATRARLAGAIPAESRSED